VKIKVVVRVLIEHCKGKRLSINLNEMVLPANGRMEKEMKQLKMNKM
jgi:hypothetical protein